MSAKEEGAGMATMVARIAKLADEAEAAGDARMVEACRLALYEDDAVALADCLAALRTRGLTED